MKTICTYHFLMRMWFLAALSALCLIDVARLDSETALPVLSCDALAMCSVLLLLPLSYEDVRPSMVSVRLCCFLVVGARIATVLIPSGSALPWICVDVAETYLILHILSKLALKYRNIRQLFENIAVWNCVEDNARGVYALLLFFLSHQMVMAASVATCPVWLKMAMPLLAFSTAAFMYVRSYLARTFLVSAKTEKQIMDVVSGNMRSCPVPGDQDDGMVKLYRKIVTFMEGQSPYLDPDFGLEELSRGVLTNKSYVSRTINIMSGRNLCAFINYYRIKYACSLIDGNPNLKVMEIAMMSGFNTVVSFNSAFKTFIRETPREYINKVREKKRPNLSNPKEQGR